MAYRITAIPMALSDLEGYSPSASFSYEMFHTDVQQETRRQLA